MIGQILGSRGIPFERLLLVMTTQYCKHSHVEEGATIYRHIGTLERLDSRRSRYLQSPCECQQRRLTGAPSKLLSIVYEAGAICLTRTALLPLGQIESVWSTLWPTIIARLFYTPLLHFVRPPRFQTCSEHFVRRVARSSNVPAYIISLIHSGSQHIASNMNETRTRGRGRPRKSPQDEVSQIDYASAYQNGAAKRRLNLTMKRIPALTTSRVFGPHSPIKEADIDLQAFLARCMTGWDSYTETEKAGILASLPENRQCPHKLDDPPLSAEFCTSDDYIKRAIARLKRDLGDGYYQKSWQDKAKKAHEERLAGKFDDYLKAHAEEMFCDELDGKQEEGEESDAEYKEGKKRKARKIEA